MKTERELLADIEEVMHRHHLAPYKREIRQQQDVDHIKSILQEHPDLISQNHLLTFLHEAIIWNDVPIVGLFLSVGVDVNAPYDDGRYCCGHTPLFFAIPSRNANRVDCTEVANYLLSTGANVNARCKYSADAE